MLPATLERLDLLQTESPSSVQDKIDILDTLELCTAFNMEEMRVAHDIARCLPTIAALIDDLLPRLRAGGRLVYVGAGNSGRVAFMDCSELPATFSVDRNQFLTLVAGGPRAIIEAQEGAEDCELDGTTRMEALLVTSLDTVIGISASGRTPFVLGALRVARDRGALTAGICSTYPTGIGAVGVKYIISALVGPELLAGSTRLKAGSAAKQILNMISTCSMIRLGKTYRGLMIDVRVNNHKLRARGRRIVRQICQENPIHTLGENGVISTRVFDSAASDSALDYLIAKCGGSVKLASAVALSGLSPDMARLQLEQVGGDFHKFIDSLPSPAVPQPKDMKVALHPELFLAIDGGGTHCKVSIATRSAIVARGSSGACNFNSMTTDELLEHIQRATSEAIAVMFGTQWQPYAGTPRFTKVWAGISGFHHAAKPWRLANRLEELFGVSLSHQSLKLTSDSLLLSPCITINDSVKGGISVISGTGSVATAFRKASDGEIIQVGRAGGWGHLIGDQGSAFDIGKRSIQAVLIRVELSQGDRSRRVGDLERGILSRLGCDEVELLATVLYSTTQPKQRISDLAIVVTALAFRASNPDAEALGILMSAVESLVQVIKPLAKQQICDPTASSLILSGALMNLAPYRDLLMAEWTRQGLSKFAEVIVVPDPSGCAAQFIAK